MKEEESLTKNEEGKNIANIIEAAKKIRKSIMADETPSDYIKTKPTGKTPTPFVEAKYVDDRFKEHIPLYEMHFAFPPFTFQNFLVVGVEVKNKITGNIELGLKAHRIQVNADKKKQITGYYDDHKNWHDPTLTMADLTPFDIIDLGNDAAAALTDAIKNAQSRFGIAADVYKKVVLSKEEIDDMEEEFLSLLKTVESPLGKTRRQQDWKNLKPTEKLIYLQTWKEELNVS